MRLRLSKRVKLILGIIAAFLLISSSTIYGLAKTGTINLSSLADAVVDTLSTSLPSTKITVNNINGDDDKIPVAQYLNGTYIKTINTDSYGVANFENLLSDTEYLYIASAQCSNSTTVRTTTSTRSYGNISLSCGGDGGDPDNPPPPTDNYGCPTTPCSTGQVCNTITHVCIPDPLSSYVKGYVWGSYGGSSAKLPDAKVEIAGKQVLTDTNGYFLIGPLGATTHSVQISKDGYTTVNSSVTLRQGEIHWSEWTLNSINQPPPPPPPSDYLDVLGTIKNERGDFISDIEMTVGCPVSAASAEHSACVSKSGTSSGRFYSKLNTANNIHNIPANFFTGDASRLYNFKKTDSGFSRYDLTILLPPGYTVLSPAPSQSGPGYAIFYLTSRDIAGPDFTNRSYIKKDIVLKRPTFSAYGSVMDSAGNYIENVGIEMRESSASLPNNGQSRGTSLRGQNNINEDYNYYIGNIPKPLAITKFIYKLSNIPNGYIWDENNDNIADTQVSGNIDPANNYAVRNFTLKKISDLPVIISGTVTDSATGLPLPGAIITVAKSSDGTDVDTSGCITTNSEGRFRKSFLISAQNQYTITADKPDYLINSNASKSISLAPGGRYTVDFALGSCSLGGSSALSTMSVSKTTATSGTCSKATDWGKASCKGPSSSDCKCTCKVQTVNYLFMGSHVPINKALVSTMDKIQAEIKAGQANGTLPKYNFWNKPNNGSKSGFYCRGRVGPKRCLLSNHGWGSAIDFNPGANPQVKPRPKVCKTDIPKPIREVFKKYGFSWGGDWKKQCDAMHFEYIGFGQK